MRRIAVVTTSRADYGLLRYVIGALAADQRVRLSLIVSGAHLAARFGSTVHEIEADGIRIAGRVPIPLSGDRGQDAAVALGRAVAGFSRVFAHTRPDIVLATGDRYEMLAAVEAAVLCGQVVGHLSGGEVSGGSLDEGWRHAITKMAHLHMPAAAPFAARIRSMGEDPWRIHVVGAPGLEAIRREPLLDRTELERELRRRLDPPVVVCTYHPVTNDPAATESESRALFGALRASKVGTIIVTAPNADHGARLLLRRIREWVDSDRRMMLAMNLGSARYLSLLAQADAVVGNSSSGIIEAAAFRLPSVNVGIRQTGRLRPDNVVDAAGSRSAIVRALERALRPAFRSSLRGMSNPYGDGRTSERVRRILADVDLGHRLRTKRFFDHSGTK